MKTIHPAVVQHAMEESEKLRGLLRELREITSEYAWDADLEARVDAALSQQADPTDTFTAVDMATAAAQGFRDGQAAVEPAPAQDELAVYRAVNQFGSDCHFGVESLARVWAGPKGTVERVTLKPVPELSVVPARTAQTEQQAVKLQHMAYAEDGALHWMSGRKIDHCELYAMPDFGRAPQLYAAPQTEQSGWISVEDRLPEVAAGDEDEFIVCVYRSHNGESYSFSARFLNDYPLHTDYEDEPTLHSGWYDVKEHADYDGWYSPLIDEKSGDKVTHWMPLPAAPALAAQGESHG